MIDAPEIKTIAIAVLSAALLFLGAAYWRIQSRRDAKLAADVKTADDIQRQLTELQSKMHMLGIAVQPITAAMSAMLVKSLTHSHFPDVDVLLEKVGPPNSLSVEEERVLSEYMQHRTNDMGAEISDLERNAAQLLPLIIERSRLDARSKAPGTIKLVGIRETHG